MQAPERRTGGRPLAQSRTNLTGPIVIADPASMGDLVRAARVFRKLSQSEMADMLGVSRGLLSGLERGERGVRIDLALKILNDLGFTLIALPPEIGEQSSKASD